MFPECPFRWLPTRTILVISAFHTQFPWWWLQVCSFRQRSFLFSPPSPRYPSWTSLSSSPHPLFSCPFCCAQYAPWQVPLPLRQFLTSVEWSDELPACTYYCIPPSALILQLISSQLNFYQNWPLHIEIAASWVLPRFICSVSGTQRWSCPWASPRLSNRNILLRLKLLGKNWHLFLFQGLWFPCWVFQFIFSDQRARSPFLWRVSLSQEFPQQLSCYWHQISPVIFCTYLCPSSVFQ